MRPALPARPQDRRGPDEACARSVGGPGQARAGTSKIMGAFGQQADGILHVESWCPKNSSGGTNYALRLDATALMQAAVGLLGTSQHPGAGCAGGSSQKRAASAAVAAVNVQAIVPPTHVPAAGLASVAASGELSHTMRPVSTLQQPSVAALQAAAAAVYAGDAPEQVLRRVAAHALAAAEHDGPCGPHSLPGTRLGDIRIKQAAAVWSAQPGSSKLKSAFGQTDGILCWERWQDGSATRCGWTHWTPLDPVALMQAAAPVVQSPHSKGSMDTAGSLKQHQTGAAATRVTAATTTSRPARPDATVT